MRRDLLEMPKTDRSGGVSCGLHTGAETMFFRAVLSVAGTGEPGRDSL